MLYRNAPIVDSAVRRTTSTTAIRVAPDTKRSNVKYCMMLSFSADSAPRISRISWSVEAKTPRLSIMVHAATVATTIMMPTATDSRNDSFITDHGSTRETASRTRRGAPLGTGPPTGTTRGPWVFRGAGGGAGASPAALGATGVAFADPPLGGMLAGAFFAGGGAATVVSE